MSRADTTTIRVTTEVRDLLNALVAERGLGNVDRALMYLLDEEWRSQLVRDWDAFRVNDPEGYREYLVEADKLSSISDGLEDEPPFESDDPSWIAAGGAPLTKKDDVA